MNEQNNTSSSVHEHDNVDGSNHVVALPISNKPEDPKFKAILTHEPTSLSDEEFQRIVGIAQHGGPRAEDEIPAGEGLTIFKRSSGEIIAIDLAEDDWGTIVPSSNLKIEYTADYATRREAEARRTQVGEDVASVALGATIEAAENEAVVSIDENGSVEATQDTASEVDKKFLHNLKIAINTIVTENIGSLLFSADALPGLSNMLGAPITYQDQIELLKQVSMNVKTKLDNLADALNDVDHIVKRQVAGDDSSITRDAGIVQDIEGAARSATMLSSEFGNELYLLDINPDMHAIDSVRNSFSSRSIETRVYELKSRLESLLR